MTSARDIMHMGAQCVGENQTLADAARMMRDLNVGSLPICGEDDRLHGIITDRDIVVKCIAADRDPRAVRVAEFAQGKPVTVDAEADVDEVLSRMMEHGIRRIPVISEHRIVGHDQRGRPRPEPA